MEIIMETNNDFERYQKAQKRVQEIKSFYRHLLISSIVMIGLIYINLKYTPEVLWFLWALLGTAIPIIIHGLKAFRLIPFFNPNWEEKKINQFMEEEKSNKK
jgi:amino acid permease